MRMLADLRSVPRILSTRSAPWPSAAGTSGTRHALPCPMALAILGGRMAARRAHSPRYAPLPRPRPSARAHPTGCVACTIKACTHLPSHPSMLPSFPLQAIAPRLLRSLAADPLAHLLPIRLALPTHWTDGDVYMRYTALGDSNLDVASPRPGWQSRWAGWHHRTSATLDRTRSLYSSRSCTTSRA